MVCRELVSMIMCQSDMGQPLMVMARVCKGALAQVEE